MKEAARTSVLSHRWENLWVYYAGSLNFDNVDATFNTRRFSIERPRFISWVNRILNLLRGSTVDGFRVRFDLDASYGDDIERWIMLAMEKTVSRFELDFSEFHGLNNNKLYQFPNKLLDSPSSLLGSFGSLTSLRLNCVDLSDEVLVYLVSNCQYLEHLSIKGATSLTHLNATTALKLKHLEIKHCRNLENVDISNTNIESLNFNGKWKVLSSLENLCLLREVSLSGHWYFGVVWNRFQSLPISQLQRLELDMCVFIYTCDIKFPESFPTLWNLKHLEVFLGASHNQNMFCLISLICASPLLSSFTLKVQYMEPCRFKESAIFMYYGMEGVAFIVPALIMGRREKQLLVKMYELPNCEWRKSEKRKYECLKVVEFIGWYGYKCDLDIVQHLIEKSVVLKKVIIDPKLRFGSKRSGASAEEIENVARQRAKMLQKYVQPGTEFVIL